MYFSGSVRHRMTRWHTASGLATKTIVHIDTGTVTFAPGQDFEVGGRMSCRRDYYADPASLQTVVCDALA